jgi:hypothetical protein
MGQKRVPKWGHGEEKPGFWAKKGIYFLGPFYFIKK